MDIHEASDNFERACQLVVQGEFELAYKYVLEALVVARSQGNGLAIGACLSVIGDVYRSRGDLKAAEACHLEGLNESRKANAPPFVLAVFAISLGEIAHQQSNLIEAERHYREALDLIGNDAQHPHYLVLVERLAEILFRQNNFPQAHRLQQKGLELREQHDDIGEVIGALRNLGLCERALGNFNEAMACFERAGELARECHDILSVVISLSERGFTQAAQGDHHSAVEWFRQALTLQESYGITATGKVIEVGLAHSLLEIGAAEEALRYLDFAAESPNYVPSSEELLDRSACHLLLGKEKEAIDILYEQLCTARAQGDVQTEAACLGSLGQLHRRLGNNKEAIDYFKHSLFCHQRLGDAFGEAIDRQFLSELETEREKSLSEIDEEMAKGIPWLLQEEAMLAQPDAKEKFLAIKEAAVQKGDLLSQINSLDRLGVIARGAGRFEEAVRWHEDAVKLSDDLEGTMRAIIKPEMLNNLGIVYRILGNSSLAKHCYEAAIAVIREEFGIDNPFELQIRSNLTKLYLFMGDTASAERVYFGEPRVVESEHDHLIDLDTQINLLEFTGDEDQLIGALKDFAERCTAAGLSAREANCYLRLGRIHHFRSQFDDALAFYDRAIAFLRRSDNQSERSQVLYYRALTKATQGHYEGAYEDLNVWVKEFETVQAELSGLAFQQQQRENNLDRYTLLAVVCIQLGKIDEALEYIERSRSQTLISFVSSRKIQPSDSVPKDLYERFLSLQADRQRLDLLLIQEQTNLQPASSVSDVRQKLTALAIEWRQALEEIGKLDPLFEQAFRVRRFQSSEIVELLPMDRPTALIEFFVADGSTMAFFASRAQSSTCVLLKGFGRDELHRVLVDHWFVPFNRYATIRAKLKETGVLSSALKRELEDAHEQLSVNIQLVLSQMYELVFSREDENGQSLIKRLREQKIERIILIPHGLLHHVPLHAASYLSSSGQLNYLIDDFEIVYAPACHVLQQCVRRLQPQLMHLGLEQPSKTLVAVADPDGSLPGALAEVAGIEGLFSAKRVLAGGQATVDAVCEALEEAGFLHFACHGQFNSNSPLDSGLLLADGSLTLGMIFDRVRLKSGCKVTLSACETGLVRPDLTDEYLGLPSGFLFAGASSILASLWEVDDTATMMLMKQTYEGFCEGKMSLSASLRQAQISLKSQKTYRHPYFWASFQAIGAAWINN